MVSLVNSISFSLCSFHFVWNFLLFRYHEHTFIDYSAAVSRSGITCVVSNPQYVSSIVYLFVAVNKLLAKRSKNCGTLNCSILDPLLIALLPFTATLWLVVFLCILLESLAAGLMQRTHNIINVCKHDKIGRLFV